MNNLIGQKIMVRRSKRRGTIVEISSNQITVDFHGDLVKYAFPASLGSTLILEDESLRSDMESSASEAAFDQFQKKYSGAVK